MFALDDQWVRLLERRSPPHPDEFIGLLVSLFIYSLNSSSPRAQPLLVHSRMLVIAWLPIWLSKSVR
jgi:hypothetical protein